MSHKVSPIVHRLLTVHSWDSKWFVKKEQLPLFLKQELCIRNYLENKLKEAGIDSISVERTAKDVAVTILAAKPGVIIGRSGQGLESLRKHIEKKCLQLKYKARLNIQALRQPALSARVVALNAANEIERRLPFRRVMKQAIERVMSAGAQGIKIKMSGRLNGVEIARREVLGAGKMSLITMRSDVDYAFIEANTIYGKIGVKVWIYNGESFYRKEKFAQSAAKEADKK